MDPGSRDSSATPPPISPGDRVDAGTVGRHPASAAPPCTPGRVNHAPVCVTVFPGGPAPLLAMR